MLLMTTVLNQLFFDQREVLIEKHCCFFCEEVCVVDKKQPNCSKCWHKVGHLSFQISILNKCRERVDKWVDDSLRRLSCNIDLVASDAIHDEQCIKAVVKQHHAGIYLLKVNIRNTETQEQGVKYVQS